MKIPSLDVAAIVGVFGHGPSGCANALRSVGFNVQLDTCRRWVDRDSLPMNGFLMISATHEVVNGKPLDINSFLKR